jgi:hypothetical protein
VAIALAGVGATVVAVRFAVPQGEAAREATAGL